MSSQTRPAAGLSPDSASDDSSAAFGRRFASRSRHPWIVWLVASLLAGSVFAWFVVPEPGADAQPGNRWSGVIRIEPRAQDSVRGGAGVVLSDSVQSAPSTTPPVAPASKTLLSETSPGNAPVNPAANAAVNGSVNAPVVLPDSTTPAASPARPAARDRESRDRTAQADWSNRQSIAAAQRALTAQGFDAGEADGIVGPRTRAAIRAWQTAAGIEPEGNLSEALLNRISASVVADTMPAPAAEAEAEADVAANTAAAQTPVPAVAVSESNIGLSRANGQASESSSSGIVAAGIAMAGTPVVEPATSEPPAFDTPVDRSESRPVRYALDPALQRFRPYERPVFERWCARGRLAMDRLGYLRCVVEQTAQFPNGTGIADLTVRSAGERERLLAIAVQACGRTGQPVEPQRYFKCVADTIQAADTASGRPPRRDLN